MIENSSVHIAPVKPSIQAIILAAGKSTRFAMGSSKLLFPLCGQAIILYSVKMIQSLSLPLVVVTGHEKEMITTCIKTSAQEPVLCIEQGDKYGTGQAVIATQHAWHADNILIINGDMPLITDTLITRLINEHISTQAAITLVGALCLEYPHAYGRIIKNDNGIHIVEARDFTGDPYKERLINAGIYLIEKKFLQESLAMLTMHENSQEWYITDIVLMAHNAKKKIHIIEADFETIKGINTIEELTDAEKIMRSRIIKKMMAQGVYFQDPEHTFIEENVTIGAGTRIGAGVHITQGSRIGSRCSIGNYSTITKSFLADHVTILPQSIITHSHIYDHATIGPFAHLRNVHSIHEHACIGNFVEVSSSTIGAHSKAKHLSYIGNATIGEKVNIGAGTITCNYDGIRKNITTIENGVKIGSNNCLIAPITIGHDALTGAGSVITHDVPPYALAIARTHQINKEQYAQKTTAHASFSAAVKTNS